MSRRRDAQHERKKLHATSHDSKDCRIVKWYSIEKILLIEQYWVQLHGKVMYRNQVWKVNEEERCKVDNRQIFNSNIGVD